jgi:predicted PurR-regulated permease PerM
MNFPPPTDRQARILWMSVTSLAVGIIIALVGVIVFGLGWVIQQLSPVLLPLAVAAILAFLLDPVVDLLQRWKMSRTGSIIIVFVATFGVAVTLLASVVPQVVIEMSELVTNVPSYWDKSTENVTTFIDKKMENKEAAARINKAKTLLHEQWAEHGPKLQEVAAEKLQSLSGWLFSKLGQAVGLFGLIIGFALVPVYLFYFLQEKSGISSRWSDYLPVQEPAIKKELVFFINSVSDALIVFFRGQVLVAMCVGALTAIGFTLIGLNYGLLLGVMTGMLGIIPYLGVMMSFVPAVIIGIVQFGDWRVALVVIVFVTVQFLEGMVISPKIIGDRVGMHPLTIIIAVITGTTLLGGIVGGILAIPITAVLRALMFRYVWVKRNKKTSEDGSEVVAEA